MLGASGVKVEMGEGVSVEYDSLRGINYKLTERAVVSYHTLPGT